jgi:hypothetical protein
VKTLALGGAILLPAAAARGEHRDEHGGISDGDAAILRFLAAAADRAARRDD